MIYVKIQKIEKFIKIDTYHATENEDDLMIASDLLSIYSIQKISYNAKHDFVLITLENNFYQLCLKEENNNHESIIVKQIGDVFPKTTLGIYNALVSLI